MSNTSNGSIDWDEIIKKEARGSGNEDLGEVQEVSGDYVLVQRGIVNKEKFYIPRDLVESYDGDVLRFRVSEEDAKSRFLRDSAPTPSESASSSTYERGAQSRREGTEQETTVPITEEKLNVSKRTTDQQATIKKEPVTETKTVEVSVTHEELIVERRPASSTTTSDIGPVEYETETKIPLRQEEVQVSKQPYVKEELTIKKKPITETRTVSDEVRSEKVKVGDTDEVTEQDE
ncbi:MAG TPA: YsnF/AvaK domain-containing protein [Nitrososphaeraceae archaeon]|jgi:uncharacterized protein (TIGR02271 family)|nr:YsnF/AvaK domain-containing protein [Nitrososphaeraceae archaeon]